MISATTFVSVFRMTSIFSVLNGEGLIFEAVFFQQDFKVNFFEL